MRDGRSTLIIVLSLVIVVLLLILTYFFLIQPSIERYTATAQGEGITIALETIYQNALNCQPIPLTYENQTINLIALECLQQAPQTQETPPQ